MFYFLMFYNTLHHVMYKKMLKNLIVGNVILLQNELLKKQDGKLLIFKLKMHFYILNW